MLVKKKKCKGCGHPVDDHSVYRDKCLVHDCDCHVDPARSGAVSGFELHRAAEAGVLA